jgi:hypothetical protein
MFGNTLIVPIPTMEEARAGRLRLFMWGWAEYDDMFSHDKTHRSEFCREMVITDVTREGGETISVAAIFRVYGKYNSAD